MSTYLTHIDKCSKPDMSVVSSIRIVKHFSLFILTTIIIIDKMAGLQIKQNHCITLNKFDTLLCHILDNILLF